MAGLCIYLGLTLSIWPDTYNSPAYDILFSWIGPATWGFLYSSTGFTLALSTGMDNIPVRNWAFTAAAVWFFAWEVSVLIAAVKGKRATRAGNHR